MSMNPPRKLERLMEDFESDTVTGYDAADMGTAFGMECSLANEAEHGLDDDDDADWHVAPER